MADHITPASITDPFRESLLSLNNNLTSLMMAGSPNSVTRLQSGDYLVIRFGVIRSRVKLGEIREVYPARNPIASPALSLNRFAICTGDGPLKMTLISPADRDGFLAALVANSGLVREGDRLLQKQAPGKSD